MKSSDVPIPPLELRKWVGPIEPEYFDNPSGRPIYSEDIPLVAYEAVFDFGCGCGRLARQLMLQDPKPRRYVGIDVHRGMIDWCQKNLSPLDPHFQFSHCNVYSRTYAPENSIRLAEPFPVEDDSFTLFIAHSVFTHLNWQQAEFYLGEVARILKPDGVAFTSWFFFDRESFPMLGPGLPICLFTSDADYSQAVIFDRGWFIDTVRRLGLAVKTTRSPGVAGHQWPVFLVKRTPSTVDDFPLGENWAEWLSGATLKPIAKSTCSDEVIERMVPGKAKSSSVRSQDSNTPTVFVKPPPPPLLGILADLAAAKSELELAKGSRWAKMRRAIGRRLKIG